MTIPNRYPGYITAIALFLTIVSAAQAQYSGGTGEPNDPYQIATAEDLIALGETPEDYDKHFILTADIDLSAFDGKDGRPAFTIIGDTYAESIHAGAGGTYAGGNPFRGVFDGNGHTIWHLSALNADYPCRGLFGGLGSGGEIMNLRVADVNMTGLDGPIGALVGLNEGTVTNCSSNGTVTGGSYVGGLVGYNTGYFAGGRAGVQGRISQCYTASGVNGSDNVGGLVGWNGGDISTSCSTGAVSGTHDVGGLVGMNRGYGCTPSIAESYSTVSVSGIEVVGGLVGSNDGSIISSHSDGSVTGDSFVGGLVGQNNNSIATSYSCSSVSGSGWYVGGLVAYGNYAKPTASFWDIQTSGQDTSDGGTGKTTLEMQTAKTFLDAGWDFVGETENGTEDIWKISDGLDYPRLAWEKYSGGTGEPNDPYQIATAEDLMLLGETPEDYDKHFILTADIDLDPNLPGRKVFDKAVIAPAFRTEAYPYMQGTPFTGVFDGDGHRISHLTINGTSHLGLFGYSAQGTEVKNLGIVDVNITGSDLYVGGLVGYDLRGQLTECYSTGTVTGDNNVGGLVGRNDDGSIVASYSTSRVSGNKHAGGLVGVNSASIATSYSNGSVSGTDSVGGLVGANSGRTGSIVSSYSSGSVRGTNRVGGLVGINWGSIATSYSSGSVSGTGSVGGLVGHNANDRQLGLLSSISNCYSAGEISGSWDVGGLVGSGTIVSPLKAHAAIPSFWDTEASGQAVSSVGISKTTTEMQMESTFTDAGWDFVDETANGTDDIWWILEGQDYPRLWWEAAEQ